MYGKLVNGELIVAPQNLELEDGTIILDFNRSISAMLEYGFKPVIDTKPGYDVDTQYCDFVGYIDNVRYICYEWVITDIELSPAEIQNKEAQKAMEMLNIDFQDQVQTLPDEQALEVPSVFPVWTVGVEYMVDFKVRYNDILYKVIQAHTSQETWTPDVAPSLFAKVIVGEGEVVPEWVKPDSTNPYMIGDRVTFEGVVYESLIDNNVWSPHEYPSGWKVVEG